MSCFKIVYIAFMAPTLFVHAMDSGLYTSPSSETAKSVFESIVRRDFDMAQATIASIADLECADVRLIQSLARAERLAHISPMVGEILQNILLLDVIPDQVSDLSRMIGKDITKFLREVSRDTSAELHADVSAFIEEISALLPVKITEKKELDYLVYLQRDASSGTWWKKMGLAEACNPAAQRELLELLKNAQKLDISTQLEEMRTLLEHALVLSAQLGVNGRCTHVLMCALHEATSHPEALTRSYGADLTGIAGQLRQAFALTLVGAMDLTECASKSAGDVIESALRFMQNCLAPVKAESIFGWLAATAGSSISGISGMSVPDPYVLQSQVQLSAATKVLLVGLGPDVFTKISADAANALAHRLCLYANSVLDQMATVATVDEGFQAFITGTEAFLCCALVLANPRGANFRELLADLTQLLDKINKMSADVRPLVSAWAHDGAARLTEAMSRLNG